MLRGTGAALLAWSMCAVFATGAASAAPPPRDEGIPKVLGLVQATERVGSQLWVGGSFTIVENGIESPTTTLAVIDLARGTTLPLVAPSPSSARPGPNVEDIESDGTNVWVAGYFTKVGRERRDYLAQYDASTRALTPLQVGANYPVHAVEQVGATLYLGGYFTSVRCGQQWIPRSELAAIDVQTGCPTQWRQDVLGTGAPAENFLVHDVTASGGKLFVGGRFSTVGGRATPNLAVFDLATGSPDGAPLPPVDAGVEVGRISAVDDGVWYAGGRPSPALGEEWFTHVGHDGSHRQLMTPLDDELVPTYQHMGTLAPAAKLGSDIFVERAVNVDRINGPRMSSFDAATGRPNWHDPELFSARDIVAGPGYVIAGGSGWDGGSSVRVYADPVPFVDGFAVGEAAACSRGVTASWGSAGDRRGQAQVLHLEVRAVGTGEWRTVWTGGTATRSAPVPLLGARSLYEVRLRSVDDAGGTGTEAPLRVRVPAARWSGTPSAERRSGCAGPDAMSGGGGSDRLRGMAGDDVLLGGAGDDVLVGGPGVDRLVGGAGGDRIAARDGMPDLVSCGPGRDSARVDRVDAVSPTCERVQRS